MAIKLAAGVYVCVCWVPEAILPQVDSGEDDCIFSGQVEGYSI